MERKSLSIPEVAIIAGTRAALGAGLGLLLGDYLSREQRRAVGWTLFGVGVVTTIPIAAQLLKSKETGEKPGELAQEQTRRLVSSERRASGSRDAHVEDDAGMARGAEMAEQ
jgi:hypothetical protein